MVGFLSVRKARANGETHEPALTGKIQEQGDEGLCQAIAIPDQISQ